jgi:glycosyltransferase involved in cell wall biosynthesis
MTISNGRPRRLGVAHLTLGLEMGGQEKWLVDFARHVDRTRFDLHFVSLTTRGCLADDIEAAGWRVTALGEPGGLRPGMMLRLAGLFRRWQIDVVHTHDERPLVHAAPAARLAGVPRIIHTRHGQGRHVTRRQALLLHLVAQLTDCFVCVSRDAAEATAAQGIRPRRVCTIVNGIDLTRFAYAGPCRNGPVVSVARLSPEKDIETLLEATAIAVREEPSFRVEIAGDGVCMPILRQRARELALEGHVRFLGQLRDVPALLRRARLFVLSSISEGISLTLLEAMARGLPVVATRVGGNPEVVVDRETGLLVPARDPVELAQALLQLHRDPDACRRMGFAARERVEGCFDVRLMVQEYELLYLRQPTNMFSSRPKRSPDAHVHSR